MIAANLRPTLLKSLGALSLLASTLSAQALEYHIGLPQQCFVMEIAAV